MIVSQPESGAPSSPLEAGGSPPAASGQADLSEALSMLRQMIASSRRSLEIAARLMLAQELAERHRNLVGLSIDTAAASVGDRDAIDRAVDTINASDRAGETEWAITQEWGDHVDRVHELAAAAEQLVARAASVSSSAPPGC
jgi:hypothetical protein